LNLIDIDIWRTGLVARAVIATAFAWCAAAGAVERGGDAYPTGLDLIERCNALNVQDSGGTEADPELQEDYGYCLGFLVGYVSGFAAREVGGEDSLFCPPESARIRDFLEAIHGWLVEHPEGLDKLGAYVAGAAFKWKFPCPPH
jgi:hypothetical protein